MLGRGTEDKRSRKARLCNLRPSKVPVNVKLEAGRKTHGNGARWGKLHGM